jgi:hemolysin III
MMIPFLEIAGPVLKRAITDYGPLYKETNLSHFIAEPWNAVSSLTFLVPVFYWLYKLRGQYRRYAFLVGCMPLLVLGGLGSTFFHAFRASRWLLYMDFMPIIILTLAVSIYLWYRALNNWWTVAGITLFSFLLRYAAFQFLSERQQAINASYFITGCMMFIPAIMFLYQTRYAGARHLICAVLLFILALVFRMIDLKVDIPFLPMGTHFLWHTACGVGIMFLSYYLVRIVDLEKPIAVTGEK